MLSNKAKRIENKIKEEAINLLESRSRTKKRTTLAGFDMMPTKSTYSAMCGAPKTTMKSHEYYNYS